MFAFVLIRLKSLICCPFCGFSRNIIKEFERFFSILSSSFNGSILIAPSIHPIGLSIKQLEEAPERPERKPRRENNNNRRNENRQRRKSERNNSQNFSSDDDLNNNLGNLLEQALFEQGGDLISDDSEVDNVIDDFDSAENTEEKVDEDIVTLDSEDEDQAASNSDEEETEY